jgi:hypothetical protein
MALKRIPGVAKSPSHPIVPGPWFLLYDSLIPIPHLQEVDAVVADAIDEAMLLENAAAPVAGQHKLEQLRFAFAAENIPTWSVSANLAKSIPQGLRHRKFAALTARLKSFSDTKPANFEIFRSLFNRKAKVGANCQSVAPSGDFSCYSVFNLSVSCFMPAISQTGRPERKALRGGLHKQYDDPQAPA